MCELDKIKNKRFCRCFEGWAGKYCNESKCISDDICGENGKIYKIKENAKLKMEYVHVFALKNLKEIYVQLKNVKIL